MFMNIFVGSERLELVVVGLKVFMSAPKVFNTLSAHSDLSWLLLPGFQTGFFNSILRLLSVTRDLSWLLLAPKI